MTRFFKPKPKGCKSRIHVSYKMSTATQKITRAEFIPNNIIVDLGLWKPTEKYDVSPC